MTNDLSSFVFCTASDLIYGFTKLVRRINRRTRLQVNCFDHVVCCTNWRGKSISHSILVEDNRLAYSRSLTCLCCMLLACRSSARTVLFRSNNCWSRSQLGSPHPGFQQLHRLIPVRMVEGHGCHRVAHAHRKLLLGKRFAATSPNKRFTEGQRHDGLQMTPVS